MLLKKNKAIVIYILILITIVIFPYNKLRFSEEIKSEIAQHKLLQDSVLTIGIIGDSWVSDEKLDTIIQNRLSINGIKSNIISSGEPGAITKTIYKNLFKDTLEKFSSKKILIYKPKYCIVIAGVNDASRQLGKSFYSHHMKLIIKTLIEKGIRPVVVSLPEFGIIESTKKLDFFKQVRSKIYCFINNNGNLDNIRNYRNYLMKYLICSDFNNILYCNFDNVCSDYSSHLDLYKDPAHLSSKGNMLLANSLVDIIVDNYKK